MQYNTILIKKECYMSCEFNEVIYNRIIAIANTHNDINAITLNRVSMVCIDEGSHIENEDVTLGKVYVDIARAFVMPNYELSDENRDNLRVIAMSLGVDDIVKMQKLNDVAFTQFYEECLENCLCTLNMTQEMYKELRILARQYGISLAKTSEIETRIVNNFINCMVVELKDDNAEELMEQFIHFFYTNLKFNILPETKAHVIDVYNNYR